MQVTTCVFLWAFLQVAQINARPQQELGTSEVTRAYVAKEKVGDALLNSTTKPEDVRTRNDTSKEREIKGLHQIDQSLRTVTTQLLNVSTSEGLITSEDKKFNNIESKLNLLIKKPDNFVKDALSSRENSNQKANEATSDVNVNVNYRRPGNSKFSYFETSHPGQAMAMTEEELERELSNSRLSSNKNPTTPGGISTWILLNPPSTTLRPLLDVKNHINKPTEIKPTWTLTKSTPSTMKIETTLKTDLKTTIEKTTHSTVYHNPNNFKSTLSTLKMEKLTTVGSYTTPKAETNKDGLNSSAVKNNSTKSINHDNNKNHVELKPLMKNTIFPSQTTQRSTFTTPKSTTIVSKATTIKVIRPNQSNRPLKSPATRKPTVKPDAMKNATSKIEKVTFKPIQTINPADTEKPVFVSKIQASFKTEPSNENAINSSIGSVTSSSSNVKKQNSGLNHTLSSSIQVVEKSKPVKTSVLKVQLKKPIDSPTTIEIKPIQVNTPVLTIEKVEDIEKEDKISTKNNPIEIDNSKIDVKFDFNPELTKVMENYTEITTSPTTTVSTTKRPKHTKRKKNKTRRRRPSSTTVTPISTPDSLISLDMEHHEELNNETEVTESSLQESKIVSETNSLSNNTKNKKKQVQKPISTQIYNFLSREVMPSVGVMSLVGLGLGIASYFFYPFGGAIARRNYEVEPNYKYNLNEYGGNYGQSEEEVLSKVFQGMNSDGKYGGMKDYEKNHFRYQVIDGGYADNAYTTRKNIPPGYQTSSVPVYKSDNPPAFYDTYHRNTDFKLYSDLFTTPNYYDRQTKTHLINNPPSADRQFVIGNIPPEYSYEINSNNERQNNNINNNDNSHNIDNSQNVNLDSTTSATTTTTAAENIQTDFEKQIAQNLQFVKNSVNIPQNFAQTETLALKANEAYEEIEISPTAVAVEHGPRSLKLENIDSINDNKKDVKIRRKRESVIQQIPSRREIQEEKKEDLSNEIFDIIDSTISTEFPIISINNDDEKFNEKVINKKLTDKQNEIENELNKMSHEKKTTVIYPINVTPKMEENNVKNKNASSENQNSSFSTKFVSNSESNSTTPIIILSSSGTKDVNVSQLNNTFNLEENNFNVTKISITTPKPVQEKFNIFNFVKTLAEVKLRLGITLLKHASENFAKYLGNVQKKLNGD